MRITANSDSKRANLKTFFSGLVPLFILAHFMHHIPGFLIQPLLPAIRDSFHLDYFQISWLTSSYTFAYGISNLPAGWLGGRIAPRLLITVGIVGVAFCGLIAGISPNYLIMIIAMLFMGILGGGYHPSASPLISDATPPEKRGQALGFHQIGGTAANIAVPLFAAALATFLTWRNFYILMTVPIIIYGVYLHILMKKRHLGDTPEEAQTEGFVIRINQRGYLRRMIAFVTLGVVVQVFVFSALNFVPLLVVDKFNGPQWAAAAILSLGHVAGLVAGPLGGQMSDRVGSIRVMLIVSLAAGPLVYLLSLGTHWWLLPLILLGMGTCMYVAMPVTESYVISNSSTHNRSTIIGIYYFASRGGPSILLPIIGNLINRFSFSVAFTTVGVALFAIALICSLMLWGTKD